MALVSTSRLQPWRKMSLVAEEPTSLSQSQLAHGRPQVRHGGQRSEAKHHLKIPSTLREPPSPGASYSKRMDKLKKTLENMGDRHQVSPQRSRIREMSQERSQRSREISQVSRGRSTALPPLKFGLSRPKPDDSNLTGDSADPGMFKSRDNTRTSSRDTGSPGVVTRRNSSEGGVSVMRHRHSQRRRKRPGFIRTFKKLGKFVCILLGLWRKHASRVKEYLEQRVDLVSVDPINDLLFDKTDYTADKQARISTDTKRILSKLPILRTEEDCRYVEVALRNYPSIAAYPVRIQSLIAAKAWYEIYSGRRIIIRQGHVAMCFYFILSGKVVVTKMEEGEDTSRTVGYLGKGDSFGETALIEGITRTATIISEGTVELLVVTDEDYEEIFTSGEMTEKYEPFLKSLSYLRDWPIELMFRNKSKAYIEYTKRGVVMCSDTAESPWIYIVISGSLTILKKLKQPKLEKPKKRKDKKRKLEALDDEDHYTYLCNSVQRQTRKLSRKEMVARYHRLRELQLGSHVTGTVSAPPTSGRDRLDPLDDVMAAQTLTSSSPYPQLAQVEMQTTRRKKMTGWQMGPMVTRTGMNPLPPVTEGKDTVTHDTMQDPSTHSKGLPMTSHGDTASMQSHNSSRRVSFDLQQLERAQSVEEIPDTFVNVQTLTKGDAFGVAELIHGPQASFSVISNGAECIMLDKRFYWERAIDCQRLMRRLKDEVLPYPVDEKMQADLVTTVTWEREKPKMFRLALKQALQRKAMAKAKAMGMAVHVQR